MNLGAYLNIENLDQLAKDNGIDIPRLRGYELLGEAEPISQEVINSIKKGCEVGVVRDLCCSVPFWNSNSHSYMLSGWTDILQDYYLIKEKDEDGHERKVAIRWDRIHGWKRRVLKFAIKKKKRKIQAQYDMHNKYAGRDDVLLIHSRMGGNNWKYWDAEKRNELVSRPWFLDRVDDWWDSTYCDFYARIDLSKKGE